MSKIVYEVKLPLQDESDGIEDAYLTLCKAGLTHDQKDIVAPVIQKLREQNKLRHDIHARRHEAMMELRAAIHKVNPKIAIVQFRYWATTPDEDAHIDAVLLRASQYGPIIDDLDETVAYLLQASDDGLKDALGYAFNYAHGTYQLDLDVMTLTRTSHLHVPAPTPVSVALSDYEKAIL